MPVFRLEPISETLDDARWETTTMNKTCWVNAASDADARHAIEQQSQRTIDYIPRAAKMGTPWSDNSFVRCTPDSRKTVPAGYYVTEGRLLELLVSVQGVKRLLA